MINTGGEGKVQAKKRVRGKIGNPRNTPEIKMHNLWVVDTDTNATYYTNKNIIGNFTQENRDSVWWPLRAYWPVIGATQWNRVGRKIRVKFLRVKGFVYYSPYLITQVRLRLVLYRTKVEGNLNHSPWLTGMYNAFNNLADAADVDTIQKYCCYNYYMSYFDNEVLKDRDCKRRVIYKGLIKPQADVPNFDFHSRTINSVIGSATTIVSSDTYGKVFGPMVNAQGQVTSSFNGATQAGVNPNVSTGTSTLVNDVPVVTTVPAYTAFGQFQRHYLAGSDAYAATAVGQQRGYFPIDVTVDMNDSIDCDEYQYVFVVESDWCVGQTPTGTFSSREENTNFGLVFTPQIFFTDD